MWRVVERRPSYVHIRTRKADGSHTIYGFDGAHGFPDGLLSYVNDDVKILTVSMGDECVYSALGSEPITWQDLVEFFS